MIILYINFGDIKIVLNFEKVLIIVKNFEDYCKEGFYNGIIFYCVIDGFMI